MTEKVTTARESGRNKPTTTGKPPFWVDISKEDPRHFRIGVTTLDKATGELRKKYNESLAKQGYIGTPTLLLSTRPELQSVMGSFYSPEIEGKRRLPMEIWQEIMIVVASANKCQYCASSHSYHSEIFLGVGSNRLVALWEGNWEAAGVDERTKLLLEYARKVTTCSYAITDRDIEVLRKAGYDDSEILEATVVTCSCNAANRFVSALSGTPIAELAARYLT